jgi:hypothetical protein
MNYGVGDRVLMRSDLEKGKYHGIFIWDGDKADFAGKAFTIKEIDLEDESYLIDASSDVRWWVCDDEILRKVMTKEEFAGYSIEYFKSIGGNGKYGFSGGDIGKGYCHDVECANCIFKATTGNWCKLYTDTDENEQLLYDWMEGNKNMELKTNRVYKLKNGLPTVLLERGDDKVLYSKPLIGRNSGDIEISDLDNNGLEIGGTGRYSIVAYKEFDSQSKAIGALLKDNITSWDWQATSPEKQRVMDELAKAKTRLVESSRKSAVAKAVTVIDEQQIRSLEQELEELT